MTNKDNNDNNNSNRNVRAGVLRPAAPAPGPGSPPQVKY